MVTSSPSTKTRLCSPSSAYNRPPALKIVQRGESTVMRGILVPRIRRFLSAYQEKVPGKDVQRFHGSPDQYDHDKKSVVHPAGGCGGW